MKRKFISICGSLLLLAHAGLLAQMKRVIRNNDGSPVVNIMHPVSFTNNVGCSPDTVFLTTQAQIDNLPATYPSCTVFKYIIIDGSNASPAITNLLGMSAISLVSNNLEIRNTRITSLSALSGLTDIGDSLILKHDTLITSIGLNNLTHLGGIYFRDLPLLNSVAGLSNNITQTNFIFMDSTGVTNLAGLSNIVHITQNIEIDRSALTNTDALAGITTIGGWLWLDGDTSLTRVHFNNLTECHFFVLANSNSLTDITGLSYNLADQFKDMGTFIIGGIGVTDLSGMDSIRSVPNFYVSSNQNLVSLHGLEHLTGAVGSGVSIYGNANLTDISALSHVTEINDGILELAYDYSLSNLNGLQNITTVGALWVNDTNLDSLNHLKPNLFIRRDFSDTLRIFNNTNLSYCAFPPICSYLADSGKNYISNNSTGCTDTTEVVAACNIPCIEVTKTWNGVISEDWNEPGNWTPAGVPDACTKVTIPDISNLNFRPLAANNITIGGLVMENGADLDLNLFNLNISKTLDLQPSLIENGGNIIASQIYHPQVIGLYIGGNFTCTDFSGPSDFAYNYFDGNVVLSDSTGRANNVNVYLNTFAHDLTCIENSNYGNFYVGNVSSNFSQDIDGNFSAINNSAGGLNIGLSPAGSTRFGGNFNITVNNGSVDLVNLDFFGGNNAHFAKVGAGIIHVETLENEKTGYLYFDNPVQVSNALTLASPSSEIFTTATNMLTLNNGVTVTRGSGSGFINGPMKKIGNQAFTFPIGKIENNTVWNAPISMSAPAAATDAFTAEYFWHNPNADGYDTSHYTPGFGEIRAREYWNLARDAGTSNVSVTLGYDTTRSGYNPLYQFMQVAGWNGSLWHSWGTSGYVGDFYRGDVTSDGPVTQFGPLALSWKPVRKPVITMSAIDTLHCQGTFFYVPFTLDTLAINNNSFHVEVSDTLGNFSTSFNPGLGSKITNHSDSIFCFTPNFGFYGKLYKIRIVGSSPSDTSANTRTVMFLGYPSPAFNIIAPNGPACQGTTMKYYADLHQVNNVQYNWVLDGGGTMTAAGDTAYVQWTVAGNHTLTVYAHNACTSGAGPFHTLTVLVNPPAPIQLPAINNTGRWIYASLAAPGIGYQWYRNGALISGATNSSYYAALGGNYTAAYTSQCGAGPASNSISFAANSLSQTINFPIPPDKNYADAPFIPLATASSGLPVSFIILSGPATINAQTNAVTVTGTGAVSIRASQSGDNIYDTAAPVTRSFIVNKASQTITFTTIPDQDISNNTVQISAMATSALNVTYSIVSGPATISGNVLTLTGIGTITVKASQAGDNNYLPAADLNQSFCSYVSILNPVSGFTNLCPGTATYSVNNIAGATYTWRIAGGSTLASTTNSANVTWPAPGDYILIVKAAGNCGAASANDSLHVHVISSILPDSVHSMLPADGAVNQQLPLTLSWIPAQPGNFYTFDLYLWKASDPQPSTPYATGITAVNYNIPINSGLLSNTAYKWMIAAHNGSCVQINTGPVQQFTLIPLPDLVVSNVQAPASAFSGQTIAINWTVSNPGPGRTTTNQSWTDAVFLSFDNHPNFGLTPETAPGGWSQLSFPVRTLLIGTKANVSALDAGQQYSNSINFTLPVSYSQPLYVYVITNYPASGNAPQQQTFSNDSAMAPQPVVVTLSPTPDLRVDTVFTPNTTFSGSTINLTYKVKNYGVVTPPNAGWNDKFYISQSPIFDAQSAVLLKAPKANGTYYANAVDAIAGHSTQLLPDSSYTQSVNLVIPNYIFGTYFIHVFTNVGHDVYEGALANNNLNHSQVQVFLTPTPHLTLSSVTLPVTAASITQPVSVNWNILNAGFNDNIEKNKGHYFVNSGTCLIYPPPCTCNTPNCICITPPPTPGILINDSTGFGGSYWVNNIYLSTDSTLTATNISSAIPLGTNNQGILNSGLFIPDGYTNPLAQGCHAQGTAGSQYNANTFNVITPNGNYPSAFNFNIPDNLAPGNYYVYVYANSTHTVYEYPGTPEIKRAAFAIAVQRPDVTVPAVAVPATAVGGQSFTIGYSVLNNGPGAVFNHGRHDNIYVSSLPVFDGSAQLISTQTYTEDLPVGTAISHNLSYTFPIATSGTRYFYVHTNYDSLFRETNSSNNISTASSPVSVSPGAPADLTVSSIQLADTVYTVFPTYFKYTVPNSGVGTTSGSWTDSIFISCNPLFNNSTNIPVTKRQHVLPLAPGANYTDSFYVNLPMSFYINNCFTQDEINTAYFFIKTNADNGAYEGSNGNNNITVSGSRVLINPLVDHIVTTVSGADTATVARLYSTGWTVKNIGVKPTPEYYNAWNDAIYFSTDSVFNGNAVLANYYFENSTLNHDQTYNDLKNITVPNIPTGDYYVIARSNMSGSIFGERNLVNNSNVIRNGARAAKKIHVIQPLLPDLADSILSCPAIVATGQPLTIIHRVTNNGPGVTYPSTWGDDLWLSADFIPGNSSGDIYLSGKNHSGALQPGQYFDDTITVVISLNAVPANYVLISRVNSYGSLFETNNNNNLAFKYVNIYSPAPSDLIVANISRPDTVYLGYELDTAKWVIQNIATNTAAGVSSDGIYLSHNTVLDSSAILVGIKNKTINISPLAKDTVKLTPLITNVTEGAYNLIVKTDLLNNIVESDKTNNTGVAAQPIYVSVKELPLNVLTPNTLYNINRFYKLIIPDSLSGATIRVALKSNDSLTVNNQLYIGKAYIPSAAIFDYAYSTPNYGNQDIVMTSVTGGVYYITVRCVSPNPVTQNITLKAEKLPFLITAVQSSSGGNIGNVTVKISGSLFTANMTAKLSNAGTAVTASSVYFTNSTTVYATFNLQGKPLGLYDVTLTKPDTSFTVLANGFSIVAANNGGLNNGGGTNTGAGDGTMPGCDPGAAGGINSQLVTQLVIPDKVFGGWIFVIQINYNNPTNSDIPAQVRTLYSEDGLPVSLSPAALNTAGTTLYLELTEQNGPPGIIRAGGSGTITVYTRAPVTFPAHHRAHFILQ